MSNHTTKMTQVPIEIFRNLHFSQNLGGTNYTKKMFLNKNDTDLLLVQSHLWALLSTKAKQLVSGFLSSYELCWLEMILYVDIRKAPEQETPSPKLGLNQKEGLNIPRDNIDPKCEELHKGETWLNEFHYMTKIRASEVWKSVARGVLIQESDDWHADGELLGTILAWH